MHQMKLWQFNKITGYWRVARKVTPATANQWLLVFEDDFPDEHFRISKTRPRVNPYGIKRNPRLAGAELKIEKILNSDLSDARKISQLQILALKTFPSSPNQKKVIAAYQALQSTKRNPRANYAADYFDRDKTMTPTEWARSMSELRAGKPRPIAKLYGRNGPTELQAMNHAAEMRAWNSLYNYAKKMYHKSVLDRQNTLFDSSLKYNPKPAGVRIVHNKLLRGWFIVRGPHQTPLGGRFDSKADAEAHLIGQAAARNAPRRNPIGALRKGETEGINMPSQSVWESKLTDALFLAITATDAKRANTAIDMANFFSKNIKSKTAIARAKKNALLRADRKVNFNVNQK